MFSEELILQSVWSVGLLPNPFNLGVAPNGYQIMAQLLVQIHLGILGFSTFIFFFVSLRTGKTKRSKSEKNYLYIGGLMIILSGAGLLSAFLFLINLSNRYIDYGSLVCLALNGFLFLWIAIDAVFLGLEETTPFH